MTAKKPDPEESGKKAEPAKAPEPVAAAPAPAPAAAPAAPKPVAPKYVPPEPVLNRKDGRLIEDRFSTWPTERFANRWSKPGFQWGAGMLAGIFLGLGVTGGLIGELAHWGDKLYALLGAQGLPPLAVESIWIAIKVLAVVHVV
ncbi:MAG: hypothetical protein NDJ72_12415, partial [Elusimicrobia bacterium]|nr:hypothetical protein [Elusimicrobiota bacterium]